MSPTFPHLPVSGTKALHSLKKDPCIPQAMSNKFPPAKEPHISAMNALRFCKNAGSPCVGSDGCVWCLLYRLYFLKTELYTSAKEAYSACVVFRSLCLMFVIAGCECNKSPIFPQERALYSPKEEPYIPPRKIEGRALQSPKKMPLNPLNALYLPERCYSPRVLLDRSVCRWIMLPMSAKRDYVKRLHIDYISSRKSSILPQKRPTQLA